MIARLLAGATLLLTVHGGQTLAQGAPAGQGAAAPPVGQGAVAAPSTSPDRPAGAPAVAVGVGVGVGRAERVELTVVGAQAPFLSLRDRIGAVTPAGVPLAWSRIDRFNPLAELLQGDSRAHLRSLRCWVDLSDLRRATLYFAAPGGERFLVREVGLSGRLDEVDQQSLTQVLELSIAALIENQEIGFSRSEARALLSRPAVAAPTVAAPASPAEGRGRAWEFAIGIFYAIEDVATTLPAAQGPGLDLALRVGRDRSSQASQVSPARDGGARPGFWLAGQYRLPLSGQQPDVGVRLRTIAARAGLEAEWWHLCARLGAGADWVQVTPLAGTLDTPAVLSTAHWSTNLALVGSLAARITVAQRRGRPLQLGVAALVDVVPASVRYQVQDATSARVAFASRRVRPGVALDLSF